jgi:probable rRNA maturation factor
MTSWVDVQNETPYAIDLDAVRRLVLAVLALEEAEGEVAVAFLGEADMAELNGRYRGLPEATDVLSFPEAVDEEWPEPGEDEPYGDEDDAEDERADSERDDIEGADGTLQLPFLGDIAVCPAVADRYATADGHALAVELGRLLVHGVLHLHGWDHESDRGEMRLREEVVLTEVHGLLLALAVKA